MPTAPLHFLLLLVSLPVVTAMPEPPPLFPVGTNMTDLLVEVLQDFCDMLLQGPQDQVPWFCLCTQCQDSQGPKGDQGARGLPGRPGSPGRRGVTGFRGAPGFTGRRGVKGQKGDQGEKGDRGLQGFVGPKGGRGFKGDKGEPGVQGHPGATGPKGDDGVCQEACTSNQGPPGPPGLPGPAGPRGLAGRSGSMGPSGLKGDSGDQGHPGAPGSAGGKGEPGPQGECGCTDGVDGVPGQKGDQGDQGDQGQTGPIGQMGPPGDKGDMGFMGMMGPPGPCMPSVQSAFAAGLASSYPPPDHPVVFSQVHYNVQGSYDPGTGLFTAPINGTYVFSYHLTIHQRVLRVGLFHNFLPVVKTTDPKVLGTTSHSVVLHLARGDRVWLQVKDLLSNGMFTSPEASSTFSGFLLHPDTCDMAFLRAPIPPMVTPEGGYTWGASDPPTPPAGGGSK